MPLMAEELQREYIFIWHIPAFLNLSSLTIDAYIQAL